MAYSKHNFKQGDILTAQQMNKIEAGIVDNENAIAQKQDKGDYVTKTEANNSYASKGDTYTKTEVDNKIANAGSGGSGIDLGEYLKKTEASQTYAEKSALNNKQDTLVSGTTIKTVNGQSLLGSGDVEFKKSISILFVGNSLTQDGIAYLPYMLKTYYPEVDFKLYMWYIGGETLGGHYSKFVSKGKANIFSVAENSVSWTNYSSNTTMAQVLSSYNFDIVCMQEYFNKKTEYTDVTDWNNCRDYIVSNYKGGNALEFISLFHAPWRRSGDDTEGVYALTEEGNALILKETISQDMIPNGIAIYRALSTELDSLGDQKHLSSDGVHTQEGLPCLMQTYVTLCWLFGKLGINKSVYGSPMRMTTEIYNTINVPGENLGSGVVRGTDAQNLLAQEIAIKAYKEGKLFVTKNLSANITLGGGVSEAKYTFTIVPTPSDATVLINDVEQTSIEVQGGKNVSWSVSKDGYITQRGIEAVNYDVTKAITLDEVIPVDEATQAYLDATGISEVAMIRKLDTMVTSLKSEGLWDKIDALYPCVGTTFEQMSYNLKDVSAYRLTAEASTEATENEGFYSSGRVTSAYNPSRLGTDLHILGLSGTAYGGDTVPMISAGPSSGYGQVSNVNQAHSGVIAIYLGTKAYVRTSGTDSWQLGSGLDNYGLFMASLGSGIVYNGTDVGATKNGSPAIQTYPRNFVHNGFEDFDNTFVYPFQVRLSGFGAALTIEEMQAYSAILNEFKSIY